MGVHLVVPMLLLDELDGQKDRGQDTARTKARVALRTLDAAWRAEHSQSDHGPLRFGELRGDQADMVTVELLPDPRGHQRLSIADDEIIDRAVWVQSMSARAVTIVTYDVGMSTRARLAGLRETLLVKDPEPSRRAERREKAITRNNGQSS
ncbi:PIN domain-containing protein [Cryptosporangium sp. NPDC051539]|uniref:PIN domain-containing protein n=1 Tax=Cryptosporangium sp. NPDC051539 TaxID=3363962 RepID=UPI003787DA54